MAIRFSNPCVGVTTAAIALSVLAASPAKAASIGFVGDFDVTNFDLDAVGNGSVDLSDAPDSITITGTDEFVDPVDGFVVSGLTAFTTTVAAPTTISFDFTFVTTDVFAAISGPEFDPFVVINDGAIVQISDDFGLAEQSGSLTFDVAAGSTFGFGIDSIDGILGEASVTISNFEAAAVPEPMTVIGTLFGGAALLGARRKLGNRAK